MVGERYPIDTTIEIENSSTGESPASYQAYLRIFRYNGDEIINFLRESQGNRFVVFTVDNKNDYSPVAGAHFYLDPKVRNNTESNFQTIINKQTQEEIPSVWNGFSGTGDAWVQDDDGVKVLRIPSGRTLTIGYEPFEAFNKYLARIMNAYPTYDVSEVETHHIHKLDAPSGTAITLAEQVCAELDRKDDWVKGEVLNADGTTTGSKQQPKNLLRIDAIRQGEVPGIHTLTYDSPADMIQITHSAHNRSGFALGAVLAAEFTATHEGLLSTDDLFKF